MVVKMNTLIDGNITNQNYILVKEHKGEIKHNDKGYIPQSSFEYCEDFPEEWLCIFLRFEFQGWWMN